MNELAETQFTLLISLLRPRQMKNQFDHYRKKTLTGKKKKRTSANSTISGSRLANAKCSPKFSLHCVP
jgi:hypothetical protein